MISLLLDVVGGVFLFVGLALLTISLCGMLRMPDTYSQLHAQGLATGPGVIAVLASSVATENAAIITFAVLGIAFTAVTSPASSHAIARTVHGRSRRTGPSAAVPPGAPQRPRAEGAQSSAPSTSTGRPRTSRDA